MQGCGPAWPPPGGGPGCCPFRRRAAGGGGYRERPAPGAQTSRAPSPSARWATPPIRAGRSGSTRHPRRHRRPQSELRGPRRRYHGWPLTEARYRKSLDWFNGLRHPVIYTPGDNEWSDCAYRGAGSFAPGERLQRVRQLFFATPPARWGAASCRWSARPTSRPTPTGGELALVPSRGGVRHGAYRGQPQRFGPAGRPRPLRRRRGPSPHRRGGRMGTQTFARRGSAAPRRWSSRSRPSPTSSGPPPTRAPSRSSRSCSRLRRRSNVRPAGIGLHGDFHQYVVDQPLVRRTTAAVWPTSPGCRCRARPTWAGSGWWCGPAPPRRSISSVRSCPAGGCGSQRRQEAMIPFVRPRAR